MKRESNPIRLPLETFCPTMYNVQRPSKETETVDACMGQNRNKQFSFLKVFRQIMFLLQRKFSLSSLT